jgi:hypothetical protein
MEACSGTHYIGQQLTPRPVLLNRWLGSVSDHCRGSMLKRNQDLLDRFTGHSSSDYDAAVDNPHATRLTSVVSWALTNSNTFTAALAGPSQSSAVTGLTRRTHTLGSSGRGPTPLRVLEMDITGNSVPVRPRQTATNAPNGVSSAAPPAKSARARPVVQNTEPCWFRSANASQPWASSLSMRLVAWIIMPTIWFFVPSGCVFARCNSVR